MVMIMRQIKIKTTRQVEENEGKARFWRDREKGKGGRIEIRGKKKLERTVKNGKAKERKKKKAIPKEENKEEQERKEIKGKKRGKIIGRQRN